MLIEKLRCESICLLSSHYAALSVNITPEENFPRVSSASFLLHLHLQLSYLFALWWWYSVMERRQVKTVLLCASEGLQWRCDNTALALCGLVVSHWHSRFCFIGQCQSCSQTGSAGCVVNLAPVETFSLWNEPRGPASAEKSQRLTFCSIRAVLT